MQNSGCYKCTDRYLGCHIHCERYKTYKSTLQKLKDLKEQEKLLYANHSKSKFNIYKKKGNDR